MISYTMPQLKIDHRKTMSNLQREFNNYFPYLKIEFFRQAPVAGIGNAKNQLISYDMKLGDIQFLNKQGLIDITDKTTVAELENSFEKHGLYVQVFRKSGRVWLETTATDNWTLTQQNEEGKNLDEQLREERENPDDHDFY